MRVNSTEESEFTDSDSSESYESNDNRKKVIFNFSCNIDFTFRYIIVFIKGKYRK